MNTAKKITLKSIDKKALIQIFIEQLSVDLNAMTQAADAARDAAINEESKSEDKHDTRSIEAGYLAGAQRKRVAELKELITFFKVLEPRVFSKGATISATALVEVETAGQTLCYFVVPKGGGLVAVVASLKIQTITPQTPLGESLLGSKQGDFLSVDIKNQVREYEVTSVA